MKKVLWGLFCASFVGTAAAGELDYATDAQYSNAYAAKVVYKVDFGGTRAGAQTLGLRFDTPRMEARGAPAFLQAKFDNTGTVMSLNGLELRGAANSAGANKGGTMWYDMSTGQWIVVGAMAVFFGTVVSNIGTNYSCHTHVVGTGSGSTSVCD